SLRTARSLRPATRRSWTALTVGVFVTRAAWAFQSAAWDVRIFKAKESCSGIALGLIVRPPAGKLPAVLGHVQGVGAVGLQAAGFFRIHDAPLQQTVIRAGVEDALKFVERDVGTIDHTRSEVRFLRTQRMTC